MPLPKMTPKFYHNKIYSRNTNRGDSELRGGQSANYSNETKT